MESNVPGVLDPASGHTRIVALINWTDVTRLTGQPPVFEF